MGDVVTPLYNILNAQAGLDHTRAVTQDTQALAQQRIQNLILSQQASQREQAMREALQRSTFDNPTGGAAAPVNGNPPPATRNIFGIDFDASDPVVESLQNARRAVEANSGLAKMAAQNGMTELYEKATRQRDDNQREYRSALMDTLKEGERRNKEAAQAFGSVETPEDMKAALLYVNDNISKKQATIAQQLQKTLPDPNNATPEQIAAAVAPITNRYASMGDQLRFRGSQQAAEDRASALEERQRHNKESEKAAAQRQSGVAGTNAELDPSDVAAIGSQVATGVPLSQAVPGYGKAVLPLRDAARKAAIQQIKDEEGVTTDADAGRILAQRGIDYIAGRRSTTQLTTMRGATNQAVRQLDYNVDKVTEEMKKLPSTDISPVLNSLIRGAERWTGDPAYSSLYFYMHAAAMESARILQGGQASIAQLHQGAAEEAKKWADIGLTPKMWDSVSKAMHDEGIARLQTYDEAIKDQRVGKRSGTAPAKGTADAPAPASAGSAPAAAIDFLKANPALKDQFKAKYGYLPAGM